MKILFLLFLYIFALQVTGQVREHRLVNSNAAASDQFGCSVATDGKFMVIGAYGKNSYGGAAYVYPASTAGALDWDLASELKLTYSASGSDRFGYAVAISRSYIAVSAYHGPGDTGLLLAGRVVIFIESSPEAGDFNFQTANIFATDVAKADNMYFGMSVAISHMIDDTSCLLVGARRDATYGQWAGSLYIFCETAADAKDWHSNLHSKIFPASAGLYHEFGWSMAKDSNRIVVGAPPELNGYVSVFTSTSPDLNDWDTGAEALLTADDGRNLDYFGHSVAVDDVNIAIGAPYADYGASGSYLGSYCGTMYIFTESAYGVGDWHLTQTRINPSDSASNDYFGNSVAIKGNAVVSGTHYRTSQTGVAHFFKETAPGAQDWLVNEDPKIDTASSTGAKFGQFVTGISETVFAISAPGSGVGGEVVVLWECASGLTGFYCDIDIDDCDSNPCINGGVCSDAGPDAFSCDCSAVDYDGATCSDFIDDCPQVDTGCSNGGLCVDGVRSSTCDCSAVDYDGATCTNLINDCPQVDTGCSNGGLCVDGVRSSTCDCSAVDYDGATCTNLINDCPQVDTGCSNGGLCVDGVRSSTCDCSVVDFDGATCDSPIDDCSSHGCLHDSTCVDGVRSYSCDCSDTGYAGDKCQSDIDDCISAPCVHGTCQDAGPHLYSCNCTDTGYYGDECQTDDDDCLSGPCENDGQCTDTGAFSFSCNCADTGFEGPTCALNIDDCKDACANGGICTDGINTFSCDCTDTEYVGPACTIPAGNDCDSSPCVNGGTCDVDAVMLCTCLDGFSGPACATDDSIVPSSTTKNPSTSSQTTVASSTDGVTSTTDSATASNPTSSPPTDATWTSSSVSESSQDASSSSSSSSLTDVDIVIVTGDDTCPSLDRNLAHNLTYPLADTVGDEDPAEYAALVVSVLVDTYDRDVCDFEVEITSDFLTIYFYADDKASATATIDNALDDTDVIVKSEEQIVEKDENEAFPLLMIIMIAVAVIVIAGAMYVARAYHSRRQKVFVSESGDSYQMPT